MGVSVREILASEKFEETVSRIRSGYTQRVMGRATDPDERERALMKFHLLDELMVDLSQHIEQE